MGFTILAFPCNQFFGQESESEVNIKKFVEKNFNVTFPMFAKIEVNGDNVHPLFKFLRNNSELYDPVTQTTKQIPWNFGKFLVDREGKVVGFYGPKVEPISMEQVSTCATAQETKSLLSNNSNDFKRTITKECQL